MSSKESSTIILQKTTRVINIRHITDDTFVLRIERNGLQFEPGQYIVLGLPGSMLKREYSIYSPDNVAYIEVLIKKMELGSVSKKLMKLKPLDTLEIDGPFGYFMINKRKKHEKYLFIASGTGISPFHCMVLSDPQLNYTVLHGIRFTTEGYDKHVFDPARYIMCTTGDSKGNFQGRVTGYLRKFPVSPFTYCYLCGNSSMIGEVYGILEDQGVPPAQIMTEVYF